MAAPVKATVEGLTAEPDGTVVAVPTGTPTAEEAGPDGKGALVGGGRTMTLPPTEVVIGGGMTTTGELTGEPPATAEVLTTGTPLMVVVKGTEVLTGGGRTTTEVLTTGTPLMVVVKGTEVLTGGGRTTTELLTTGTPLIVVVNGTEVDTGGGRVTTELLTTGTPLMVVVKGTEVLTGGGRVTTELLPLVDGGGRTIGAVPDEVFLGADVVGVTVPFVTGVVMVQGQLVIVKVVALVTV